MRVLGQFNGKVSYNRKESIETIVVAGLRTNLLGLPAIIALKLIARVEAVSVSSVMDEFPALFQGLGNLGEPFDIGLQPSAKPYALFTPRNIQIPLRQKVRQEFERMLLLGVISKVDIPTPWCAGMVVAPKKNGDIRICVDFRPLNSCVLREVHPLPKVGEILALLTGARIFSKLDANSGFWQIPLSEQSKLLTTFITPYGRYCFNKMPFGIRSAPEHFQKRMSHILEGLEGVVCQIDDILVFGKDQDQHDAQLMVVLRRIQSAGVTLNKDKCKFSMSQVSFLGHIIDETGIRADPEKTAAIQNIEPPRTIPELRRFLGMVNQLSKFSPNLAQITQPLRELLKKARIWQWTEAQQQAFTGIKEFSQSTVLCIYDPNAETKISADASSHGLGAVLLQKHESEWKPVAYASRSLSHTEANYAQIEKEALTSVWACEMFSTYVLGMQFMIETDRKPLVALFGSKHMDELPPRIFRFSLRLARFDYMINHVAGKMVFTADTLSRAPRPFTEGDVRHETETECLMEVCVRDLPASPQRLQVYCKAQQDDPICAKIIQYVQQGWPDKHKIEPVLKHYWKVQGDLVVHKNLLLYGKRIVVPKEHRRETLKKLHQRHQGIVRCQERARISVWWPGIGQQIKDLVQSCPTCVREFSHHPEPWMLTPLPDLLWQQVSSDLFVFKGESYVVVTDYYSRYPEVLKL